MRFWKSQLDTFSFEMIMTRDGSTAWAALETLLLCNIAMFHQLKVFYSFEGLIIITMDKKAIRMEYKHVPFTLTHVVNETNTKLQLSLPL